MICAAYLAKCGQKIMVVEKNMEVGGGLIRTKTETIRLLAQHSIRYFIAV
jgi:ribulose 1,5-bisphosphate synthetase/thiazole synthase